MGDAGAKAQALVDKATKKLKGWSLFGNKYEDAVELLEKAATQYKLAKMWTEAASTFCKLAECHLKCDSKHEAASSYVEAANASKKVDVMAAIENYKLAVSHFSDMGRLSIAAKHINEIADLLEKESEFEKSCDYYMQAADLYSGEDVGTKANSCKLKVAQLSAQLERYLVAIEIFEEVAKASLDNNLLKFSVKGYLLNAGICLLCHSDIVGCKNAVERFQDLDPSFSDSRECKLLSDLVDAVDEGNQDKFAQVLADYDSMSRLDPWKTTLLLRAKKKIAAAEVEDDLT